MKTYDFLRKRFCVFILCGPFVFWIATPNADARPRPPWPPMPEMAKVLFHQDFDWLYRMGETNRQFVVQGFGVFNESWSGYALQRSGKVMPYVIPALGLEGKTNVACDNGGLRFWFKPEWSSGSIGDGYELKSSVTLAEFVIAGKELVAPVWSLVTSADGSALLLLGPGEKDPEILLKAEVHWQAGTWHQIVVNYGKQTELVVDGEVVATGGSTLSPQPKLAGLVIGSSHDGRVSAEGDIEEIHCFGRPLRLAYHYDFLQVQAAMGPISQAEDQAMAEWRAERKAERELLARLEEENGGGMMLRVMSSSNDCVTGGPWYLTNTVALIESNNSVTVRFDIAGGTNGVPVDIFTATNIVGNDVTNAVWTWLEEGYTCETHEFTNQPNTESYYILTTPGADRDGDGLYDGWEWKHFGTLQQDGSGDFDGDGVSNLGEFNAGTEPNTIGFWIGGTNDQVSGNAVGLTLDVTGGVPSQQAVLVDSTNFAAANWTEFASASPVVNLPLTEGWHDIWMGLKGRAASSRATWRWYRVKRDTLPPMLVITNPTMATLSQPMLQLQGYCPENLSGITYDRTNAAGLMTNQQVLVLDRHYESATHEFTTNTFQGFDVELTNGVNTLTLRATDMAGNVTTTNLSFTVDYAGDTNVPGIQITWPQDGTQIGGDTFTLDGRLDDFTAQVTAQIVSATGETNTVNGLVERDGKFWVEDLPLSSGTNGLTLTITDAAGNTSVTNLSVVQSAVVLTMNPVTPESDLWKARVNLSGTISVADQAVWVNGVKGVNHGDGTWTAENVPTTPGGTASFTITAYEPNEQQPDGSFGN